MEYEIPKIIKNSRGETRKVGVEMEFSEVDLRELTRNIQQIYGGEHVAVDEFYHQIKNSRLGDFTIKIDARIITHRSYQPLLKKVGINFPETGKTNGLGNAIDKAFEGFSKKLAPFEVNIPPVSIYELHKVDAIRGLLFDMGLQGTSAHPVNVYATHINAEAPSLSVQCILDYIRSFILLYPWLLKVSNINWARQLTPYIKPYKPDYCLLALAPGYHPDARRLIDDYHAYHPDRNYALDLYPLFSTIDKKQVDGYKNLGDVKPRPTFHYRLPNSEIENPEWTVAYEWNNWVKVENLAADPQAITSLSREYIKVYNETIVGFNEKWKNRMERWLAS